MRRVLKVAGWSVASIVLLAVLAVSIVFMVANTAAGRSWAERLTWRLTSGHVKLVGLDGTFPSHLTLAQLQLIDERGVWLSAEQIALDWSIWELLGSRIHIADLKAAHVAMERTPVSSAPPSKTEPTIPHIDVMHFAVARIDLGAALVGSPASLVGRGSVELRSLKDIRADVAAHRIDGDGEYQVRFRFDRRRIDANVKLKEPANGPLENLLGLPGLGVLDATLNLSGLRGAEQVDLTLDAGELHGRVQGSVNLIDLGGDLEYSLTSPALTPRPEIHWQRVALQGQWRGTLKAPQADGQLLLEELTLSGGFALKTLNAKLSTDGAKLLVRAVIDGLRIPGSNRDVFAKDPLTVSAAARFDDDRHPVELTASHALFGLHANALTAPEFDATLDIKVPQIATFAALAGQDVRGQATINARVAVGQKATSLALDAGLGLSGGTEPWLNGLGKRATVQFSGDYDDAQLRVGNLRVAGDPVTLVVSGKAERQPPAAPGKQPPDDALEAVIKNLQLQWEMSVGKLSALSPSIDGTLKGSGRLEGTPSAMTATADVSTTLSVRGSTPGTLTASIHLGGLPSRPIGSADLRGTLDGAPLKVAIDMERGRDGALHGTLRDAEWKSLRANGEMSGVDLARSTGTLHLQLAQLGDIDRLIGAQISGELDARASFNPMAAQTQVQFDLDARNVAVGSLAGNAQLHAAGPFDALNVKLVAHAPDLQGAALDVSAGGLLHLTAGRAELTDLSAGFRGVTAKLLSPTQVVFADGLVINQLNLGAGDAQLHADGRLSPSLDLRASLEKVSPNLVNAFSPQLLSEGNIEARVRLQGVPGSPTGRVHLNATGLRFGNDAASDLPAVNVQVRAELGGDTAVVDARLSAGDHSLVTASGPVPLNAQGSANLAVAGKLAVGLINPVLEARGMHAAGDVAIDATVRGPLADPNIDGAVTLSHGSLRDYARGINLTEIAARLTGSQGTLQVQSFEAKASSGTMGMSGSIGLLQPMIPVDLKITAHNAQPIASSIVTANLNADLDIKGTARERLDVVGTVHLNKTNIGIPDSFPPDVAVLDVRRRGVAPAPVVSTKALVIGLDVTVQAPQQILVQGRGLDAELHGDIHIGGTTDEPQVSGGFDLTRGSFSLAGSRLNFVSGRVSFEGVGLKKTIDPTLDFVAQTSLSDGTATVRISGFADSPKFEFSSSPPMEQDEILARLLFGENVAQLTALQAAQIGAALATLSGVGGGSNPLVKLQKSLGLDRLSVGSGTPSATPGGEPTGASIAAGRYISKRVYVEGKQNTTGSSQVQVDVDITSHLKLQTKLGNGTAIQGTTPENDPGSSIGLTYQFEY